MNPAPGRTRARSLLVRTLDANSRRDLTSARWSASGDRSHERRDDEDTEGILLHISPRGLITRHGIYRTCEDAPAAVKAGAVGVGLFRSEFLFMGRRKLPDEEEQFQAYLRAVQGMEGLPVTIRTIDEHTKPSGTCFVCGQPARYRVALAKAY